MLHNYNEADLHLYFSKKQIFMTRLNKTQAIVIIFCIRDLDKITKFTYKLYFKAFMNIYMHLIIDNTCIHV